MQELFYIVNVGEGEDWYRLHYKPTHSCLGGFNDYEPLLKTAERLVKKYKTPEKINRVVSKISGVMSKATLQRYEKDYEDYEDCEVELNDIVEKSLRKIKESHPLFKTLKRYKENPDSFKSTIVKDTKKDKETSVKEIFSRPRVFKRHKLT